MHAISTAEHHESPMNSHRFHTTVDAQAQLFTLFAIASPLPSSLTLHTLGKR
jgi:hypothetical protein